MRSSSHLLPGTYLAIITESDTQIATVAMVRGDNQDYVQEELQEEQGEFEEERIEEDRVTVTVVTISKVVWFAIFQHFDQKLQNDKVVRKLKYQHLGGI